MNVISLSKRQFERLEPLKLSRDVTSTESKILLFPYRGEMKVIKQLFHKAGEVFANKLYTLEMLAANIDYFPENFCIPSALASSSGDIQGPLLDFEEGINFATILLDKRASFDEKKYYLIRLGEILSQLSAIRRDTPLKDFYICDLHPGNIIVNPNNKGMKFVDLDSSKIGNNKSSISKYLCETRLLEAAKNKYHFLDNKPLFGNIEVDENTDLYCYCIIILSFLFGERIDHLNIESFCQYISYLESIGINHELINVFLNLITNKKNKNPGPYVESITEKQFYKAKKVVYNSIYNKI